MIILAAVYARLLRVQIANVLTYRGSVILHIVTSIFPLVVLAGWLSILGSNGGVGGWDRSDFVSYYVTAMVVNQLTRTWVSDDWEEDVRSGHLSAKLLNPTSPIHHYVANQLAHKVVAAAVMVPMIVAAVALVPALRFAGPTQVAVGLVSVAIAFALNFFMAMSCAMSAFWSQHTSNLYQVWAGVGFFLSGWVIPLDLLPPALRFLSYALPFRYVLGFPARLFTEPTPYPQIASGLALSLLWTAAFYLLYRVLLRRGLRRYEAVGA